MNRKIIRSVLKNKLNAWASSIDDENVRDLVKQNTIITGGCITSMLIKEQINDFDIYFKNKETVLAVASYYVNKFKELHKHKGSSSKISNFNVVEKGERIQILIKSAGVASESDNQEKYEYFEGRPDFEGEEYLSNTVEALESADNVNGDIENDDKPKFRPVFLTDNAITLSDKIQIVIRFYGEPKEIHKNYDYIHCTNYWTSHDNDLVLHQSALESILSKQLYYSGSLYPVCSLIRMRKFMNRGWHINAGQILKMCFQISSLDLSDVKVLEDQLVGVDTAYFVQLIKTLEKEKEKNPEFNLDMPYLVSLIDKLF